MAGMTRKYRSKIQRRSFHSFINEAKTLRDENILTDFTLECEDVVFPVHKMVLAASSTYFREFFTRQRNVKKQKTRMTIDFIQSEVLQIILEYFYTRRIIIKEQSPELLKNLLEASSKLQIPLLCDCCLELLLSKQFHNISLDDWKKIEDLNNEIANKVFLKGISKNLSKINQSESFFQCTPIQIILLLFSPEAVDCDQSIVLQSIVNWVKYNSNERKRHLTMLLEKVDFNRINPNVLSSFKDEDLLIGNTVFLTACSQWIFKQGKKDTKKGNRKINDRKSRIPQSQVKNQLKEPSTGSHSENSVNININTVDYKLRFFIFGIKDDYPRAQIFFYDYASDKLEKMIAHPLCSIPNSAIVSYKDKIYSVGEYNKYRFVFVYNLKRKQWKEINYKPKQEIQYLAVELSGFIYVADQYTLKNLECYDPSSDEWKVLAEINVYRVCNNCENNINSYNRSNCAYCNHKLPVIGFVAGKDCLFAWYLKSLHKYNPEEDKWSVVETELNNKGLTDEVCLAYAKEKIFLIQKLNPSVVWIYDTENSSLSEDIIPVLKECDGIINLNNPTNLEFVVSGNGKWLLYRPHQLWTYFDPKQLAEFKPPMLTLLPA